MHQERLQPYHRTRQAKLTEQHKQKRLHFVTAHKDTDWHAALFVDEKKLSRYTRPNSKNDVTWAFSRDAVPGYDVLQRGPELMVWGGMSSVGVTPLHRIQGTLDSNKNISILNKTLLPASHQIFPSGHWLFFEDNARCHSACATQQWLKKHIPESLPDVPLPPNSPDLNPIENLWGIVQDKLNEKKFTTVTGLWKALGKIWKNINTMILQNMCSSMSTRLKLVQKAKGRHITLH